MVCDLNTYAQPDIEADASFQKIVNHLIIRTWVLDKSSSKTYNSMCY